MGLNKVFLLLLALWVTTSHSFNHLTPWDKEVIYNWKTLVKAGTDLPTPHASQFILEGKIHLQSNDNATLIKITDLTYKLYNGILDHDHEHEAHNIPVQIHDLEHVFKVIYNTNGLAIGIVTNSKEKDFSINIKKAIATILQLDHSVVKETDHHHLHTFVLNEDSIYGNFEVDYTVKHHENGDIMVQKLHHMKDPHHLYQHTISNQQDASCDVHPENPLSHVSHKEYFIVKQDGHHIVKEISTIGVLNYQPFQAHSDHQFILVNQTFHLAQVVPIQEQFVVQSEHFEDHLTYHYFIDSVDGSVHDVTNGRHVVDYDKYIPNIQHMLQDIHHYLHEDHINTQEPDSKRGQLINRVQRLLQVFTLTKLHELHKKLSGDALEAFYHILPLVGSKASTMLIKHLVINKAVEDHIAVEMIQHFPEHVVEPTVELLSQLEELIHLDDNISWEVRKSGIISFATLIHKSYMFVEKVHRNKNHDHHIAHTDTYSHQQPYEKYVMEYINTLRSTKDMKIRMAYTYALCNIKLHSIIEHLLPAVKGEWHGDYHFRLMSLWALGSSVVVDSDPNAIMEVLWPIMFDTQEINELRVIAFYYFIKTKPDQSRLMNMYEMLVHEPSEEFYHFAYSFLHDIMHANSQCNMEFHERVAQLVQLLPVPTHGESFVKVHDYKDLTYGFSNELSQFFVNGHHSLLFAFSTGSEVFNIHHKGYMMYFKIHGVQNHGEPINMLYDIFKKKNTKILSNNEVNIECVVARNGVIINTFFFDQHSLHELDHVLNFFTKESHSISQKIFHISYAEYYRTVIPTDLGTPAVWEFLMPVVHYNVINATKETVNKVMNIHIDNKYVNWVHYRHGLSFYNPIADIWQGINRYHSYDAVLPLRLEISINTQQKSVQISWKKHSNDQHNVIGLRSHVKQMVYVKDDNHVNALVQSSPQCQDFVVVTHGKQFRHNYVVSADEDLSTGHQWHIGVYDSSRYVSNGSFNHLLDLFTQSHPQTTETWISHFLKSVANWHQYVVLLPDDGTYGFIARIEPSHHHAVSNIDLSFRVHSEPITDDDHYYTPKMKWSTRVTYSVKNQEKSLKTWDINTILDMNVGHTVNNLKMHITRIIPGQKDYKICVEGNKKWTNKGVEGHLTLAMSQSQDGKCVQDDTLIDVVMNGHQSDEQVEGHHKYGSCEVISPYELPHKHSMQCLVDHTTVRHYVYNVKTMNVPSEFKKTFVHWWDTIKAHYMSYYIFEDEHNENIADHTFKVDVVYPMQDHEVDVHVTTPQHVYKLTGIPIHHWKWLNVLPDSLEYPKWLQFLHVIGYADHCVIEMDHFHYNHHKIQNVVGNDWMLYVADSAQNPQIQVYVKHTDNDKIAVKVVDHGHTIEIIPHGVNQQISLDGQIVPVTEYHHTDWVYCHVFSQDHDHPVAVFMHNSGLHVEYHQHQVVVVVPKKDQQYHGHCYSHH